MRGGRSRPTTLAATSPPVFPDPRLADARGLVAVGGDLSMARLLAAYEAGIFPWYEEGLPPLWWSPDPRAVLEPEALHVSRSLARTLRRGRFDFTWNRSFLEVMRGCAARAEGTWIVPEMFDAYAALHRAGHAHSLEVWYRGSLAGGLYGVQRGGLFAAESMFHRVTDASKVALVVAVRSLAAAGVVLFDVQLRTAHLASMGVREIPRESYLERVREATAREVDLRAPALFFQAC